jgi:hypothetical protein
MSVVDHIENEVYRMIDEYRLDDGQQEDLFLRFSNALITYDITEAGKEYLDKVGGGTD